jgi:transcriptional regulator with XRE-family HTH domain
MAEGDSPTVARRRVRLAIREARDAAGLTQSQVAEAMEWSHSKVIRIENGEVSISPNDLRPLLSYLGIQDKTAVAALLADARIARTRQRQAWYQAAKFREHLSPAYLRLIEYEAEARSIRYYQLYFMPGPLQLPEYAATLLAKHDEELSAETIRVLVEARRLRREAILNRLGSLEIFVLLDESVLRRPIGGPGIFVEQLRELHRLSENGHVSIRMIPFSTADVVPLTNNATFDLLSLSGGTDEGEVLYRESGLSDEIVEDKMTTSRHLKRYQKIWHEAATEVDTINFIRERIESLEATIKADRQG